MNVKITHFVAALASTAALLASAQPTDTQYTSEPIASAAKAEGATDAVNAVVQALNADAGLKNAKITVTQDDAVVLLTGVALTKEQSQHATEIAMASASGAQVVNAIQPDHTTYQMPTYELKG